MCYVVTTLDPEQIVTGVEHSRNSLLDPKKSENYILYTSSMNATHVFHDCGRKYDCNAATIYGNADTIVKERNKSFELRTAVEIRQLGQISLART